MGKFKLLQAVYCFVGIGFAAKDLLAGQPIGNSVMNAFIWPYAQWPLFQSYAMQAIQSVTKLIS